MGTVSARLVDSGNEWATPQWVVDEAAELVGGAFNLDPAATPANAKAPAFFTREDDGLSRPWFGRVWLNPPFSKPQPACAKGCRKKACRKRGAHLAEPIHGAEDFARKVVEECRAGRVECIAWHGPAATDTRWFAELWPWVHERVDYTGRIGYNGTKSGGTFPSQTLVIRPTLRVGPLVPSRLSRQPVKSLARTTTAGAVADVGVPA